MENVIATTESAIRNLPEKSHESYASNNIHSTAELQSNNILNCDKDIVTLHADKDNVTGIKTSDKHRAKIQEIHKPTTMLK